MEEWTLQHPRMGAMRVVVGWPQELRAVDPGFPSSGAFTVPESDAAWQRRAKQVLNRDAGWRRQSLVAMRGDTVVARLASIRDAKIHLIGALEPGAASENITTTAKPRLEIRADPLGRHITDAVLRNDDEVLVFEPPEGSPGARRHAAMDASPWKRVVYPILGGLGRSGWALAVILLGPVIARVIGAFVAWILSFFPPIHWPSIPWPTIHLPRIPWPDIDLPSIPWPHVDLPPWLVWMLDHPKVWMPIAFAVFWAISSSRAHAKSQAKKAEWAKREEYARLAGAMRELRDRRAGEA